MYAIDSVTVLLSLHILTTYVYCVLDKPSDRPYPVSTLNNFHMPSMVHEPQKQDGTKAPVSAWRAVRDYERHLTIFPFVNF